jgi:hypothetical protein
MNVNNLVHECDEGSHRNFKCINGLSSKFMSFFFAFFFDLFKILVNFL